MIKSIINEKDIDNADVVLISAGYDKTASSHKGTKDGPKKVVQHLHNQVEFWSRKYKKNTNDFVKTTHKDLGNLNKLNPEAVLKKIRTTCDQLIEKNKFIFLLGGEHSVSIGHFQALVGKYKPKDVTIVQIDAHCDLRKDDSDYSDNPTNLAHSTVMRHASSLGYPIVQIGIRSYSDEEYKFFSDKKNNVKVFEWSHPSKKPEKEDILKSIKTKYIYITIDVDGFDPSVMPGTGTPVPGGLKWNYGVKLLEKLINKFELVGADLVEVSPQSDTVITEYASAELVYQMITEKFRVKLK
jgi:agmatinase